MKATEDMRRFTPSAHLLRTAKPRETLPKNPKHPMAKVELTETLPDARGLLSYAQLSQQPEAPQNGNRAQPGQVSFVQSMGRPVTKSLGCSRRKVYTQTYTDIDRHVDF